jgi:hypothetical protein
VRSSLGIDGGGKQLQGIEQLNAGTVNSGNRDYSIRYSSCREVSS